MTSAKPMSTEKEVWCLFETGLGHWAHRSLMGIYDSYEAAQTDAEGNPQWSVEKWTVDTEPQA